MGSQPGKKVSFSKSFSPPSAPDAALELLIEFGSRREENGGIEYRGASVTYDTLTVVADHVAFNKNRFRLEADGNVVVQNNTEALRARAVGVDFQRGEPIVSLITGAIESVGGEGWIQSQGVHFRFDVTVPHSGHLVYEDRRLGIRVESISIHSFRVADDVKNVVTFAGVGRVNGTVAVPFIVTVQDNSTGTAPDTFSIRFNGAGLEKDGRTGVLSRGNVLVHRSR